LQNLPGGPQNRLGPGLEGMSTTPHSAASLDGSKELSPDRIGGYRILGVLGRGGMGVVYDAIAPHGERVALKVIRPQGDPEHQSLLTARFMREAKILEQLNHPGVVRLIDAGDFDGILYLAMERIEGVSLLTIRRQGPLGYDPLVHLGIQLADTLAHMHEAGVIHRDIKPANILIDSAGHPIITDFGISGLHDATGITRLGDLLGSPGFMAPEVTEGAPPSELSDQFALGRLLYELGANGAAKRLPKNAPILEILSASLEIDWNRFPKETKWGALESILMRMVATRPADRYPTARAVKSALRVLSGSDLLDSDTLSEHLGALGLKPTKSWEIEVAQPDESELLAQNQKEIDEVLKNLHLPGRERSEKDSLPFIENTAVDPTPPGAKDGDAAPKPSVADLAPEGPTTRAPPADASKRSDVDRGQAKSEAPTIPPPGDSTPGVRIIPPPALARRLATPMPEVSRYPSNAHAAPPARSPSGSASAPAPDPSTREPFPAPTNEPDVPIVQGMRLYEIAKKKEREDPGEAAAGSDPPRPLQSFNLGMQPPATAERPERAEPAEAQIARLERQIARLRDQLEKQRVEMLRRNAPEKSGVGRWLAAMLLAAAGGIVSVLALHHPKVSAPPLVLVAPASGDLVRPLSAYQGTGNPSSKDVQDAIGMLESAQDHLDKKDVDGAEGLLEQCIALADLAECHRMLATILALTRNPAARTHFEQYLHIAPAAPDADLIRKLLERK
jgi:serine/threonine protein kinase